MTALELDENKLREELIIIYQRYISNQQDRKNLSRMDKIEKDYSSACNLIKSKIINQAVNLAGSIEEKELSGSNTFLDDKDSVTEAKKILEELRKS